MNQLIISPLHTNTLSLGLNGFSSDLLFLRRRRAAHVWRSHHLLSRIGRHSRPHSGGQGRRMYLSLVVEGGRCWPGSPRVGHVGSCRTLRGWVGGRRVGGWVGGRRVGRWGSRRPTVVWCVWRHAWSRLSVRLVWMLRRVVRRSTRRRRARMRRRS